MIESRSEKAVDREQWTEIMELPLFPLKNVVLFPGMVLPLHVFEMRYREMINRCLHEKSPFGVVLIDKGEEVGEPAQPHLIGTTAKILHHERQEDGRMNVAVQGVERFRIKNLHHHHSYLTATIEQLPIINGGTKMATELAQRIRPYVADYVALESKANNTQIELDRLPEDPMSLAFLIGISLKVDIVEKQALLALPGIPEMLARELHLISRENLLLQYVVNTQKEVQALATGPTGCIFPN